MAILLEKISVRDIGKLLQIEKSISSSKIYSSLKNKKETFNFIKKNVVFFIMQSGVAVGDISYRIVKPGHAHVSGLVITPRFQKKGIGKKALSLLLKKLGSMKRIDLVTHPRNVPAIKLYFSFGFVIESWKNNYYGDGEPRILLSRPGKASSKVTGYFVKNIKN